MQRLDYSADMTFPLKVKVFDFGKPSRFNIGQFDIFIKTTMKPSKTIKMSISNTKFLISKETELVTKCDISNNVRISPILISNPLEIKYNLIRITWNRLKSLGIAWNYLEFT